jgi:hypothetical protein
MSGHSIDREGWRCFRDRDGEEEDESLVRAWLHEAPLGTNGMP